jgi:protein ImuB
MSKAVQLYAALLVREFPAQALLRLRNDLYHQPCVVMQGEPPLQQVASLNMRAKALGLMRGMTKTEVEVFSNITTLRRSWNEEKMAKLILLECVEGFSPRIEQCSEDGEFLCVIDIAGTEKLFGPAESLARKLLSRVKTLGIVACVAVSDNFDASIALAKGMPARHIQVAAASEKKAKLAPLPIAVLSLTEEQKGKFSLWGIHTLAALAQLPEKELIARLGQEGKRLRQMAHGEMPHLFQPVEPVFSLEECMELESPVVILDALMFVVNVMLEQLILRATARVLALASLTIRLALEGGSSHSRTVRPAQPTNERQIWLKLLHLDLELHPPIAAILGVELEADPGHTSKIQLGLFSPQLPEPSRLDVTLARIRSIVGDGNVGSPVLQDTNKVDEFRMESFHITTLLPSKIDSRPLRSAMRMVRSAELTSVTVRSQRPKKFTFRDHYYLVEHAYGPWVASGEWWTSRHWECEQWDLIARSQGGKALCCCLMHDCIQGDWRMVAIYD